MNDLEMIEAAKSAAEHAYAPYSNFRVGAVVKAPDGRVFGGANVENAAYGSSVCAETVAIVNAISHGIRQIDTVAVACIDAETIDAGYPCGNCRQHMQEFETLRVIVAVGDDHRTHELEDLLPYGFEL